MPTIPLAMRFLKKVMALAVILRCAGRGHETVPVVVFHEARTKFELAMILLKRQSIFRMTATRAGLPLLRSRL